MTDTVYLDISVYMIMSRGVLLRIINISDTICRENQNTHFIFNKFFSRNSCRL